MTLTERVARLEDEIRYLRAIVDGGEVQAREAVVVAVGLLACFAAGSGALDYDRLIRFLDEHGDAQPSRDDRTGLLIHGIRLILAYHRDLEDGLIQKPVPVTETLGAEETVRILARAEALIEFEREDRGPIRRRSKRRSSNVQGSSTH